jgi:hypothetical protein
MEPCLCFIRYLLLAVTAVPDIWLYRTNGDL